MKVVVTQSSPIIISLLVTEKLLSSVQLPLKIISDEQEQFHKILNATAQKQELKQDYLHFLVSVELKS